MATKFTDWCKTAGNIPEMKIGSTSNYHEINTSGEPKQVGSSAVGYLDLEGDLFGKRLNSITGKVDYDWDENLIKFYSGGSISTEADRVQGNIQWNHFAAIGSQTFAIHLHWKQSGTTKFVFTLKYRIQHNGSTFTSSWTTQTLTLADGDEIYTYPGSGDFNQITVFPDITATMGISDILQFQLARTDSLTGDCYVSFCDLHAPIDTPIGSFSEWSKTGS